MSCHSSSLLVMTSYFEFIYIRVPLYHNNANINAYIIRLHCNILTDVHKISWLLRKLDNNFIVNLGQDFFGNMLLNYWDTVVCISHSVGSPSLCLLQLFQLSFLLRHPNPPPPPPHLPPGHYDIVSECSLIFNIRNYRSNRSTVFFETSKIPKNEVCL